eukprot:GHRR01010852.1.p1 GENE.GHRR01010852.1~~GHRR01010852.1.p1  ORF type:complete len:215 (+),score=50.35 GHRR01010852.1:214-858(+)
MSLLRSGTHMQQCTRQWKTASDSSRPVMQVHHHVPKLQLLQQQPFVSRLSQQDSNHCRRLSPVQARRRSPVIAPDIIIGKGEEQMGMDLFNYLLRQRVIFLSGYVNDKLATQIVGSLLALEAMDEEEEIRMYINSPGGTPYSVIGVVDAMQSIKPPIQTVALGACYSYSSLLLVRACRGDFAVLSWRVSVASIAAYVAIHADSGPGTRCNTNSQ